MCRVVVWDSDNRQSCEELMGLAYKKGVDLLSRRAVAKGTRNLASRRKEEKTTAVSRSRGVHPYLFERGLRPIAPCVLTPHTPRKLLQYRIYLGSRVQKDHAVDDAHCHCMQENTGGRLVLLIKCLIIFLPCFPDAPPPDPPIRKTVTYPPEK